MPGVYLEIDKGCLFLDPEALDFIMINKVKKDVFPNLCDQIIIPCNLVKKNYAKKFTKIKRKD